MRVASRTGSARRIWEFWKSQFSWDWSPNEKGRLSGLAEARRICALRAPHEMGGRWKSRNRKNVYLSPYVEEPLNSKVIKSFEPELRSRKCFSCFEIPIFYVYMLWTFYVRFTLPYHGYVTRAITFTFRLNSLVNVWTFLSLGYRLNSITATLLQRWLSN